MSCRLCLGSVDILIPVYNENGADVKGIAETVSKYIGVALSPQDPVSSKICISCWASVDNFQKFCRLVAERQLLLPTPETIQCDETAEEVGKEKWVEEIQLKEGGTVYEDELQMDMEESEKSQLNSLEEVKDVLTGKQELEQATLCEVEQKVVSIIKKPRGRPRRKEVTVPKKAAIRESNARKLGRPSRNDAEITMDEDRLIASYMKLVCDICQLELSTYNELKQHFKTAHNTNGYAVCCQKRLYKRGILIDHINVHKDPEYFKCSLCSNVFADRVCLRNHTLLKHKSAEELHFQCKHCDKKFAKIYLLQRHAVKHTPRDKCTFICDICNKGYPTSSRLKSHEKNVHGDGSLKVCNHCGKVIRGKYSFIRHMEKHEGTAAQRGVQCEECGHWLSDKYCLRIHKERHQDQGTYTCELCGKESPSRLAMSAHFRYHHLNTELKHKCKECKREFKTSRALREHITTHTGETLYTCTYCDKKFKCSSNLHSHRKWQHPVEWTRDRQTLRTRKDQ